MGLGFSGAMLYVIDSEGVWGSVGMFKEVPMLALSLLLRGQE